MVKITREILINAPVEEVFKYHSDPRNEPEYWPSMLEVKDLEELPDGGHKYGWVYKMAGIRLEGSTETTEFIENERIATKTTGGVDSRFVYTYRPEDEGTRMTMEVEYEVPVPVLGKLAEAFILKVNEREADTLIGNLKDRLEAT